MLRAVSFFSCEYDQFQAEIADQNRLIATLDTRQSVDPKFCEQLSSKAVAAASLMENTRLEQQFIHCLVNYQQNRVTLLNSKCEITGDSQLIKVFGMFTNKLRPSQYLIRLE